MKTITSQFVGSDGLIARIIKFKGSGPYSHVDIVTEEGNLLGAQAESFAGIPPGVEVRPSGYDRFTACARVHIEVPDDGYVAFWNFLHAQIGKPYDTTAVIAFLVERDWREPDSWFCSELCMAAHIEANVFGYPLRMATNKVDPNTAFAVLSTYGRVEVVR